MSPSILYLYSLIIRLLPATRFFELKRQILMAAGATIGGDVRIVSSASFLLGGQLVIDKNTWIGHEVLMVGGDATIHIGESCDVAPRVTLATGSHEIDVHGARIAGKAFSSSIAIGRGCWICTGATILGGTDIGEFSVVAAGSVVRGAFPPRSLIGGVPARVLRDLTPPLDGPA